jgi:glycosyltransferase involved in cell wall biosynthesis
MLEINSEHRIPKRIIQTGKSVDLPLRMRAMVSSVKLFNPDFEYLYFDDAAVEAFIEREFPEYRKAFDTFAYPIQRYDFFRYLVIYRLGGFYLDTDVMLARGLSSLLDCECVFPFEGLTFSRYLRSRHGMDWQLGNFAFGATAGHPFLEALIGNCVRGQEDPRWVQPMMRGVPLLSKEEFFVLNSTGPGLVSRTLAENPNLSKLVIVLFPKDVCDVTTWNQLGDVGVHFMEGSWRLRKSLIRRKTAQYLEAWQLGRLLKRSAKLGKTRKQAALRDNCSNAPSTRSSQPPLVSILIPAFNAEAWIADTLCSALAQTWQPKEIIVVDDGSTDNTIAVARHFEPHGVRVVTQRNQGAAAARNTALALSGGDYIQWLDADDLLAPDKIGRQMAVLEQSSSKRTLASCPWGRFMYRAWKAQFTPTVLWCNLEPKEWLLRKMEQNIYMQTATWLLSRELAEAAGAWDTRLLADDDGEYFCRVLLASDGVQFVPEARVYYRSFGYTGLSYIGLSRNKCEAHWISMKLHVRYLRSLEDSTRVRAACLRYLRNCLIYFYPEMPDVLREAEQLALDLGEPLGPPSLSWKYYWVKVILGWRLAKLVQMVMRRTRWRAQEFLDRLFLNMEHPTEAEKAGIFRVHAAPSLPESP